MSNRQSNRQSNTTNNVDKVVFTRYQLAYLEKLFGTWDSIGKAVSPTSDVANLNRLAGQQDVIDAVRQRTQG